MARTMTLLNRDGDVTVGWTEEQDAMMREVIQRKLDEGYTFFLVNLAKQHIRLRQASDLGDTRQVVITDKDAEELIRQGKIGIVTVDRGDGTMETTGRAKTAEEIAQADTLAVKPFRGG